MDKKLPNIYANPISKKISNVQETYYGSLKNEVRSNVKDVMKEVDAIFASRNFVYKSKVEIETNDGVSIHTIVGRTALSLLTIDGKVIPISSIIRIEKK